MKIIHRTFQFSCKIFILNVLKLKSNVTAQQAKKIFNHEGHEDHEEKRNFMRFMIFMVNFRLADVELVGLDIADSYNRILIGKSQDFARKLPISSPARLKTSRYN